MEKYDREQIRKMVEDGIKKYIAVLKGSLENRRIIDIVPVHQDCMDGSFILILDNGFALSFRAEGDDMAHIDCELLRAVTCPMCEEFVCVRPEDAETFNRLRGLGQHDMLYWKYNHRTCAPGGTSGPFKAKGRRGGRR